MTCHQYTLTAGVLLGLVATALAGGEPIEIPDGLTRTASVMVSGLNGGRRELDGVTWSLAPGRDKGGIGAVGRVSSEADGPVRIPLGQAAGMLHFLHTAIPQAGVARIEQNVSAGKRIPAHPPQVWGYRLHYADGMALTLHVDWRHHVGPLRAAQESGHMYMCRPIAFESASGRTVLYHMETANPRPGKRIETIELVAPEKGADMAQPLLLAVSTSALATVEIADQPWSCMDYTRDKGPNELVLDPATGELGVPYHGKSDRGCIAFRAEPLKGDFRYEARLVDLPLTASWGFAGITARSSVLFSGRGGADVAPALVFKPDKQQDAEKKGLFHVTAGKAAKGRVLLVDGKPPVRVEPLETLLTTPVWLRLDRRGDSFYGYTSPTGKDGSWAPVGELKIADCPDELYLGMYTALSHGPEVVYAKFDKIRIAAPAEVPAK